MVSRRNIRVKVMQLLYIIETAGGEQVFENPVNELQKQLDKSRQLLVYLVYFLSELARYAETDARKRGAKNLTTEADLNVNIKLASNDWLNQILENPSYKKSLEKDKPQLLLDKVILRKLYNSLVETPEYTAYIADTARDKKKEKEIIQFIFTSVMLPDEAFITHIEELFNNWDDDADMMEQLVLNYLQKPGSCNLQEMITEEKWQFAKMLLTTLLEKKQYALELITPKLQNWDADRIAVLDMILMQMGVCEFLYFETIPPKVTINEYIDLAKDYSTPQSGHFVNGVLDSIHKELMAEGKIQKIDFKAKSH